MRIVNASDTRAIARLLTPTRGGDRVFERRVQAIVDSVRSGGDRALERFARRFDQASPPLEVSPDEMRREALKVDPAVRLAIKKAASHIARVAFQQIPRHIDLTVVPGVSVEQRIEPLDRVGCYVPGGRFPLPSSRTRATMAFTRRPSARSTARSPASARWSACRLPASMIFTARSC